MAEKNIGKITQIIGAVLDIKFQNEMLPEINSAINITRSKVSVWLSKLPSISVMIQ